MQVPSENKKGYRTPFEELSDELDLEDPNGSSKLVYKILKYIEDNIIAALCKNKKCNCCKSVKSIINKTVTFDLLKMQNDSGPSPQLTSSLKLNYKIPNYSSARPDSDVLEPAINILSNVTIHNEGGSNKMNLKGGQNTTSNCDDTLLTETGFCKEDKIANDNNKKMSVKKRRNRTSYGSEPYKPKIRKSASPLKQTKSPCSPDISMTNNVNLVTLDTSGRFKEKSLKNNNNERESTNINDDQMSNESNSNEFVSRADHISKYNESTKKYNKMTMKKRRKKSQYNVPGNRPYKSKIKFATLPLKSAKNRTSSEWKDIESYFVSPAVDENIGHLNHKKEKGSKSAKRKSGGNSTEQPTKKSKGLLNESESEVNVSSTSLKFYEGETKKSSCKGNKEISSLKYKSARQKLIFNPEYEYWEKEFNERNKRKMSKPKRRLEEACKYHDTSASKKSQVRPTTSKSLRHANFLNERGRAVALTEMFYRSKKPQTNPNAISYIYALIDNKKFKISVDRTKNGTFSKAVLKRLSRKGGYGLTLGASFLERESLSLQPMKHGKSVYSPSRWLTSKLFDDMCLYD